MHKLLSEDGGLHCYRCGAFFANPRGDEYSAETTAEDYAAMRELAGMVPCDGPTTEHPGYFLGIVDGQPYRETCAAHPYAD
jgi:hypothetical protein